MQRKKIINRALKRVNVTGEEKLFMKSCTKILGKAFISKTCEQKLSKQQIPKDNNFQRLTCTVYYL